MGVQETAKVDQQSGAGCLVFIAVVALFAFSMYGGWLWLDRAGLLKHTVESVINADASWITGETKYCDSQPLSMSEAKLSGKPVGFAVGLINCSENAPLHNVKIDFYGLQEQPDVKFSVNWKCTRKAVSGWSEAAFECRQTGSY